MNDFNILALTGRLVRDPVVRPLSKGGFWAVFTVASNYRFKDKNGSVQKESAFVECKVFGFLAEGLTKHKKGDRIMVAGRIKTESWEKDGRTQSRLILICDDLRYVLPENGSSTPGDAGESQPPDQDDGDEGNPPF
jgi:single-strand DNA-binding protein